MLSAGNAQFPRVFHQSSMRIVDKREFLPMHQPREPAWRHDTPLASAFIQVTLIRVRNLRCTQEGGLYFLRDHPFFQIYVYEGGERQHNHSHGQYRQPRDLALDRLSHLSRNT